MSPAGGFADFFPAAPRAAKVKAKIGEDMVKPKSNGSLSPAIPAKALDPGFTANVTKCPVDKEDITLRDAPAADGVELLHGDTLNGFGSTSPHTSSASSAFSTVGLGQAGAINGQNILTPLTNIDTSPPRPPLSPAQTKPPNPAVFPNISKNATYHAEPIRSETLYKLSAPIPTRVFMRRPGNSVQGSICTYDPILDDSLSKSAQKKSKPIYKDFGTDDDAPPADPRLKRGKLNYINVDFHNAKARLRHAPYLLRPYQWDPRTSVGPGPPTEVIVSGFDPLVPFSSVTAVFASFGDIAESSNKMHPDTGSYLGFATFRYRDSKSSKSSRGISAIDAAKRAVRNANATRIGQKIVKVEFDPEGKKSVRKLEETLKNEEAKVKKEEAAMAKSKIEANKTAAGVMGAIPTGPRIKDSRSLPRPSPAIPPRGPSAFVAPAGPRIDPRSDSRQGAALGTMPGPPAQPSNWSLVEDKSIGPQLSDTPYIFIGSECVPVLGLTIAHMKKRLRLFQFKEVRADRTGYYVIFDKSTWGRGEASRCYTAVNKTAFFTYTMEMHFHVGNGPGPSKDLGRDAVARPMPVYGARDASPTRQVTDRQKRDEMLRLKKEYEADLEEEKRQRAKNLDPTREAVEVIRRELIDQLLKTLRTRVAAPALYAFLDPDKHADKRRKLNLSAPGDARVPLLQLDDNSATPSSTPNARAEALERRLGPAGGLTMKFLPKIRKAKTKDAKRRNLASIDPLIARARADKKPIVRNLLQVAYDSDEDEDDERENRSSARETEEPESRQLTDDEETEDDHHALPAVPRKRKMGDLSERWEKDVSSPATASDFDSDALRKKKIDDEELFGIPEDTIDLEFPHSRFADTPMSDADSLMKGRSQTPDQEFGAVVAKMPKNIRKRKSKKQVFEEREALKLVSQDVEVEDEPPVLEADETAEAEPQAQQHELAPEQPQEPPPDTRFLSHIAKPAVVVDKSIILDIAGWQTRIEDEWDRQALIAALRKKGTKPSCTNAELWAWKQTEMKALNRGGHKGVVTKETRIEGYYVPNPTGSARTEGTNKILNSVKSLYLPHRLKVVKEREERQARAAKEGKDVVAEAAEAARIAAERALAKGNSRASRVNNRRFAADVLDQRKTLGVEADSVRFNQLKKRKKPVKFERSPIHNWGLFAVENIAVNDMIIEYVGEKVRQQVADHRESMYLKSGIGSSYLFRIDEQTVIDATKKGGIARFINHSCMPNCTAKIIKVEGSKRIVIYAMRDIAQNEELTYDYKFEREIGSLDRVPCLCGTTACKGFLN